MAQTRRKRRSKHRGTAVGTVEARGRTGRKPTSNGGGARKAAPRDRGRRKPSWKSAYIRAFFAALFLFVLTRLGLGGEMPLEQSILFAVVAMFIYVPLGYYMDVFIIGRREKREAAQRTRKR